MIDRMAALERIASGADPWRAWRIRRLAGDDSGEAPAPSDQDPLGGFPGETGRLSPGATGEAICHLIVVGLKDSGSATIAGDWLEEVRTPAQAWLDDPADVPGALDHPAGGRVWATAAAAGALLALGRDPGSRAFDLLRGESDVEGHFTGGTYPTLAAAAAYWLAEGPETEIAEWALRWARETIDDLGPWDLATGLTFWAAASIGPDHASVETFTERLNSLAPSDGFPDDDELTIRSLEALRYFGE